MYLSCINSEGRVGVNQPTNTSFHNIPIENLIKVPRDQKALLVNCSKSRSLEVDDRPSNFFPVLKLNHKMMTPRAVA